MINYKSLLEQQLIELDALLARSNKNLGKLNNLPNYRIKVSKSNGCNQIYLVDRETGALKYANKKDYRLVKKLVQRDYETAVNKKIVHLKKILEKFISSYDVDEINEVYDKLSPSRKEILIQIIESDVDYIQRWIEEHPDHQNDFYGEGKIATSNGGYVRSKSERIIADLLDKYQVPYRYEPRLELRGRNVVYPDFIVLNVRKRQTIYWEHLGLLSEYDYAQKNFNKINDYEEGGLILGRDVIVTMETENTPINIKLVEEKIKRFCL